MKVRIWSIFTVLCVAICVSCSSEEPKVDIEDETSTGINDEVIKMVDLTGSSWSGTYYLKDEPNNPIYETVEVQFEQQNELGGVGTMTITEKSGNKTTKCDHYKIDFSISGDKVVCKATKQNAGESVFTTNVVLEYRCEALYFKSSDLPPFILNHRQKIDVDLYDPIIEPTEAAIRKLWLHENGMNILDFRDRNSEKIWQLVEPGSKEYNYFNLLWIGPLYDYGYNKYEIVFEGYTRPFFIWNIKKLTAKKLVLQGRYDDFEDVYYEASPDILPEKMPQYVPHEGFVGYEGAPWGVGGQCD